MIKLKNNRADSKLISIWWFAVLFLIAGGIVAGTLLFYSRGIDVRALESNVLSDRVLNCLVKDGYIKQDFLENKTDIFKECGLSEKIINKSSSYYLSLSIIDLQTNKKEIGVSFGNMAFEKDCKISLSVLNAENYPKCSDKKVVIIDEDYRKLELNIVAGSNYQYRPE